jgi:pimeloyl-ACP methyl ester carboxylesterase
MPRIDVSRAGQGQLSLAYDDIPGTDATLPAVLLIHGFASSRRTNWISPGWYRALGELGRRVIAFDHRGHGESEVSHKAADYDESLLAGDCAAVLDACNVRTADAIGYSMGAMVTIRLLLDHTDRIRRAVLAGLGENYLTPPSFASAVPDALLTDDPASITDLGAKGFRIFADAQKQDRIALAACWQRPRTNASPAELGSVSAPVLVICGENDTITGSPDRLAASMPQARAVIVPRRDHMTAVGDRVTRLEALGFLGP